MLKSRGKTKLMKKRLLFLLKLFLTFILIFLAQKVIFMLVNLAYAGGMTFKGALAVLWHGLRLDSATSCYLIAIPSIILLLSLFFKRFPLRRILFPYYLIISLVMSVIFIADMVIYHFWGAKIDATDLIYAANLKDLFASVSVFFVIVAILIIILVAWGNFWCLRRVTPVHFENRPHWVWSFAILPLFGLIFLGMRNSVKESTANPSYAYHSSIPFQNHAALNPLFNMTYSLFKVEDLAHEFQFYPSDQLDQIIGNAYRQDARITDTLFTTDRPDIMLIIWESGGSDMVMNDSVGPNMMRLKEEGIYLSNCHANSFRTDRGLVSILNGWPGLPTTSLMTRFDKCSKLPSMAHILRTQSYHTRFIYGGDIDFTNTRSYLSETGYYDIWGNEQFPAGRNLSKWGTPDEYVLQSALKLPPAPYFTTILTLSSHEPWDVPYRQLDDKRKNAFAYTDSCINVLVNQLRDTPQWENLLIIITPDHGIPIKQGQATADWHVSHIPVIMVGGAVKQHREIDRLMNQSDLAATLLAQMGLDISAFPFSRNILSPTYPQQPHFAIHAYKNGINYIDSTGVTTFDCIDQKALNNEFQPSSERERHLKAILQLIYKKTGEL